MATIFDTNCSGRILFLYALNARTFFFSSPCFALFNVYDFLFFWKCLFLLRLIFISLILAFVLNFKKLHFLSWNFFPLAIIRCTLKVYLSVHQIAFKLVLFVAIVRRDCLIRIKYIFVAIVSRNSFTIFIRGRVYYFIKFRRRNLIIGSEYHVGIRWRIVLS